MDYGMLASELLDDPLGRGYASMSDREAVDSLNAANRAIRVSVSSRDIRKYVLMNGLWPRISGLASDPSADLNSRGAAITLLETIAPNSFDVVSMDDPQVYATVEAMANMMISAGTITADHRDAVLYMSEAIVSRAVELGIGSVDVGDVQTARKIASPTLAETGE